MVKKTGQNSEYQDRIYFFGEINEMTTEVTSLGSITSKCGSPLPRTTCKMSTMLDWLLQFRENASEPCLKLFSRIALGNLRVSFSFLWLIVGTSLTT